MESTPFTNTRKRLEVLGEILLTAAIKQGWLQSMRDRLATGEDEEAVKAHALELVAAEGLTFSRLAFPMLNRKARRLKVQRVLEALAKGMRGQLRNKTVGDVVDSIAKQLGFDDWVADAMLSMAKTGEPVPYHPIATGRVVVMEKGFDGSDDPTVWVVATPDSEPAELAEEFLAQCKRVFPAETYSSRNRNVDYARYIRLNAEGMTDEQIAEQEIGAEELERLAKLGPLIRQHRVDQEVDRIGKGKKRLLETMDKIFPDSVP